MKKLILLAALVAATMTAANTTVTDTVYDSGLSPVRGKLYITPSQQWTCSGGQPVYPREREITIATTGVFTVSLCPTDTADPLGVYYTARFVLSNSRTVTEIWTVPTSGSPVGLSTVRTLTAPTAPGTAFAPTTATYITQTPSAVLSAEQALSPLSTGLMKVTNTTGAVSSVTTSAGISGSISDETGSGAMVFGTQPTIDKPVLTSYTVATLPTGATNMQVTITDSTTGCTVGGGSSKVICRYNGAAWDAISASGSISGLTINRIVTAASSTTVQTPTANATMDSSGNATLNSLALGGVTNTCDGTAGCYGLKQGTAPSGQMTTGIEHYAPVSVTSYRRVEPGAAATGLLHLANSSNTVTETISAVNLAGADVTGTLPVANGGTGITSLGTGVATALGANVSGSGAICLASGSACSGGGATPPVGATYPLFGYFDPAGGLVVTAGNVNGGYWTTWIADRAVLDEIQYNVQTAGSSGEGLLVGLFALGALGVPTGNALCYWLATGTLVTTTGDKTSGATVGGTSASGGHCAVTVGGAYSLTMSSDSTTLAVLKQSGTTLYPDLGFAKYSHYRGVSNSALSTGTGVSLAFTTAGAWAWFTTPSIPYLWGSN